MLGTAKGRFRKWDFSRRGLEEEMESRHDLLAIFDDIETHTEEAGSLRTALRNINQIPTSGQSKLLSSRADLPFLKWTAFALTSSPEPIDVIAERLDLKRTYGQLARFIDIPVPKAHEAGIFDRLEGDALDKIEEGKKLIKQLDLGVTQNYGLVMPRWLNFLFEEDRSSGILKLRDAFLKRVLDNGDGFDQRYAVKFAVPAVAGYLAAVHGIVPWRKSWPVEAAEHCYHLAVKAVRKDADIAATKLRVIVEVAMNPERFVPARQGASEPIRLDDGMFGLRTSYQDQRVLAFRDEAFNTFAGSDQVRDLMIEQLRLNNVLLGGHGHAGTTQLALPIRIGNRAIEKPRFWIIHLQRLRATRAPTGDL